MRPALALLLALPALTGCTGYDLAELDPMKLACQESEVQQAGWCQGAGGEAGGDAERKAPKVERTADGIAWSHEMAGEHGRHAFAWDSPGRGRLQWTGAGTGGMRVTVQDAGGAVLYSSRAGTPQDDELLAGRAGSWSVALEFDNFAGAARASLRRG